jgi:hypothetical protein
MLKQTPTPAGRHLWGRAGVLVGAAVWLSLVGSPAVHAGDGGLLDDAAEVVDGVAGQAVEPVTQTAPSSVPPPVDQAVAPTVQPVVSSTATAAEETVEEAVEAAVEAVVRTAEQATEPVVRVIKPTTRPAAEPVAAADQVVKPAPAPVAPHDPVTGAPNGSGDVSHHGGAADVTAGVQDEQHPGHAADRAQVTDLAPRAEARPGIDLPRPDGGDDPRPDPELWERTLALMEMWAGQNAPSAVSAGLPGHEATGPPTLEASAMRHLLLGLLLGVLLGAMLGLLSLVLTRRRPA